MRRRWGDRRCDDRGLGLTLRVGRQRADRAARRRGARTRFSGTLSEFDLGWLTGRDGERFMSEFRFVAVDETRVTPPSA